MALIDKDDVITKLNDYMQEFPAHINVPEAIRSCKTIAKDMYDIVLDSPSITPDTWHLFPDEKPPENTMCWITVDVPFYGRTVTTAIYKWSLDLVKCDWFQTRDGVDGFWIQERVVAWQRYHIPDVYGEDLVVKENISK